MASAMSESDPQQTLDERLCYKRRTIAMQHDTVVIISFEHRGFGPDHILQKLAEHHF
jgi:hypothetical protein